MVRGGFGEHPGGRHRLLPGERRRSIRTLRPGLPFAVHHLPLGAARLRRRGRGPAGSTTCCCSTRLGCTGARRRCRWLAQLATGRLDAVWGSRRLSVRDIETCTGFRYRRNTVAGVGQLPGKLRAEPGVSGALRALHHRHAVRLSARCGRRTRSIPEWISAARTRQSRAPRLAAPAQGGDPRVARPLLPAVAGSREADERARRPARSGVLIASARAARQAVRSPDYAGDASAPLRPVK